MRLTILVMVLVTGCVAAEDAAPTNAASHPKFIGAAAAIDEGNGFATPEGPDVCTLAAQLPEGDLCAHVCDMDAMKAQLLAEGEPPGTCLEFNCTMPDTSHVIVGVCLAP